MTTFTYDYSHLDAAEASRAEWAEASANLESIEQDKAEAAKRLSNVQGKLLHGDTTVTTTQYRNARDEAERFDLLQRGAASIANGKEHAVVNLDTAIADAIALRLHGDDHPVKFPINVVVGVNQPRAEVVDPLRPVLYVWQAKPAQHDGTGLASGECMAAFYPANSIEKAPEVQALYRYLQVINVWASVDSHPVQKFRDIDGPGYRFSIKFILPRVPVLWGGPSFEPFLKARCNSALTHFAKSKGLHGVARAGVFPLSAAEQDEKGTTTQSIAVRLQMGFPLRSDLVSMSDELTEALGKAARFALDIEGAHRHVGSVERIQAGSVPNITLSVSAATANGEPTITAEATATYELTYRAEKAPYQDSRDGGIPEDVVTDEDGVERYRWEIAE
jgi:hypothetical protein